jgi:small conductance mechanosensitive channel
VASAGFAGIALGFGAQSLIEDVITGLFMLVEDQFSVGDRIDAGVVNGTVEALTLRSTVVRDPDGTVWHIPNSEIRRVANESQHWSRAKVEVGVAYNTPLSEAIDVLESAASEQAARSEWAEHVLGAPEVVGVQELGADSINIRVQTRVAPEVRRQYERDLRRSVVEALNNASIEMPNRQVDVWARDPQDLPPSDS